MRAKLILMLMLAGLTAFAQSPNDYVVMRAWEHVRRGAVAELWTPAELTTGVLWLDAADADTLTLSGSSVTQWDDKSGFDAHATVGENGNSPTYSNDTKRVYFKSSNLQYFWTPLKSYHSAGGYTAAVAMGKPAQINDGVGIVMADRIGTTARLPFFLHQPVSDYARTLSFSGTTAYTAQLQGGMPVNSGTIYTCESIKGGNVSLYRDGSQLASVTGPTANHNTNQSRISIGSYNTTPTQSAMFDGWINEIVVTFGPLSEADRQRVEGYLAHKWGLTANLPSDHPYKNAAPTK